MRIAKALISLLLLFVTPTFLVFPQHRLVCIESQHVPFGIDGRRPLLTENSLLLSYDEIIALIDDIESGRLSEQCSREEIERINHFIANLAREGAAQTSRCR